MYKSTLYKRRCGSDQTAVVKLFSPLVKKRVDLMQSNHGLSPCILALTTSGILIDDRSDTLLTEAISSKGPDAMAQCWQDFPRLTTAATNRTCFGTQCETPIKLSGLELEWMNIRSNLANTGKDQNELGLKDRLHYHRVESRLMAQRIDRKR
jgi:hypothetical protein